MRGNPESSIYHAVFDHECCEQIKSFTT